MSCKNKNSQCKNCKSLQKEKPPQDLANSKGSKNVKQEHIKPNNKPVS